MIGIHQDHLNDTLRMESYDFGEHRLIYGEPTAISIRLSRYMAKKNFLKGALICALASVQLNEKR